VTRVALVAGLGSRARALGALAETLTGRATVRTCLDAGGPIQVFVEAPGPRALRLGMATGRGVPVTELEGWSSVADRARLEHEAARWHDREGWTVWSPEGLDWYADVRGAPDVVGRAGGGALPGAWASSGTPWAVHLSVRAGRAAWAVQWLLARAVPPWPLFDAVEGGGAAAARALFAPLMGPTLAVARWVVARPVDPGPPNRAWTSRWSGSAYSHATVADAPGLRFGCGRWSLVPEDARKHEAVTQAVRALGGPDAYAGAVWSLLRGLSGPNWRVGRGLEGRIVAGQPHLRLILVPEVAGRELAAPAAPEAAPRG
jgi:hypothetical protein